ncbi:hypothetical protein C4D60_Mb04t19430 [Musa balbisiana]|uniref:Uncharacterized protein n=1 Tax=Musa balbisiana TaxID=52838 RepID=A0A4S8KDB7_MUSBA|nr:hypothetical protein C4D60_Mb04t19430 [Musa balbisiana]
MGRKPLMTCHGFIKSFAFCFVRLSLLQSLSPITCLACFPFFGSPFLTLSDLNFYDSLVYINHILVDEKDLIHGTKTSRLILGACAGPVIACSHCPFAVPSAVICETVELINKFVIFTHPTSSSASPKGLQHRVFQGPHYGARDAFGKSMFLSSKTWSPLSYGSHPFRKDSPPKQACFWFTQGLRKPQALEILGGKWQRTRVVTSWM